MRLDVLINFVLIKKRVYTSDAVRHGPGDQVLYYPGVWGRSSTYGPGPGVQKFYINLKPWLTSSTW